MEADKNPLDNIELRSESTQEILKRPPHYLIRSGNSIICLVIIILLLISYIIKYPELVSAPIIVTTQSPVEKLEVKVDSKIEKIFVEDHKKVKKDEILMVFQSTGEYEDVLELIEIVDTINDLNLKYFPIGKAAHFKLGEIQAEYNLFAKAYQDERLFTRLQPYAPEELASNKSLNEYQSRIKTLSQKKLIEGEKYNLAKKNYDRAKQLFEQGVIAAVELESEKVKLLQAQQNIEELKISYSQLVEGLTNIKKGSQGIVISSERDRLNFSSNSIQLLEQLRKSLVFWQQTYLLKSSIPGTVSYQQYLVENQYVKSGEVLISILPNITDKLIGRMLIPSLNSGKVVPGQKILIKLDNYQFQEFGIIEGKVKNVSLTPDLQGNYYVDVVLPNNLKTNYNKTLKYDKELRGTGEIITDDLRLIQRILYRFRKVLRF